MRNGDYIPTRMEAQHDAVNLICGAKTEQNPENTVRNKVIMEKVVHSLPGAPPSPHAVDHSSLME